MKKNPYTQIQEKLNTIKAMIISVQEQINEFVEEQKEQMIDEQEITRENIRTKIDSIKHKMENSMIRKSMMEDDLIQVKTEIKELIPSLHNITYFESDIEKEKERIINFLIDSEKQRYQMQILLHPSQHNQFMVEYKRKEDQIRHMFDMIEVTAPTIGLIGTKIDQQPMEMSHEPSEENEEDVAKKLQDHIATITSNQLNEMIHQNELNKQLKMIVSNEQNIKKRMKQKKQKQMNEVEDVLQTTIDEIQSLQFNQKTTEKESFQFTTGAIKDTVH